MNRLHLGLQLQQIGCLHHGLQRLQQIVPCHSGQQVVLGGPVGVTQTDTHQKAVKLRFGQRLGAALFQRVLRGDHEKGLWKGVWLAFHADLAFFHGFQQSALRLGAGAVDFVGQQDL